MICVQTRHHRGEHGGGRAENWCIDLRPNPAPPGRARRGPGTEFLSLPSPPACWGRRVGDEGAAPVQTHSQRHWLLPCLQFTSISRNGCIPQLSPALHWQSQWHEPVARDGCGYAPLHQPEPRCVHRLQAGQSEQPIAYGLPPPASRLPPHTNSRMISRRGRGMTTFSTSSPRCSITAAPVTPPLLRPRPRRR